MCACEHKAKDCRRDAVNTAATLELITSSGVVHWEVRKDLDGLIEVNFYKYLLDAESN